MNINLFEKYKGILAADESPSSIGKRFDVFGIENTHENRIDYRQKLLSDEKLTQYISGVILHEETFNDFVVGDAKVQIDNFQHIAIGVKVDSGLIELPSMNGEKMTLGLDTLDAKLKHIKDHGATFTKWRSVVSVLDSTDEGIHLNMRNLAIYASFAIKHDLTPILEPEVILSGSHTLIECEEKTRYVLTHLLGELALYNVDIEKVIFKIAMVLPGANSGEKVTEQEIIEANTNIILTCIPQNIMGVVYLSGGQSLVDATYNLGNIIHAVKDHIKFPITYSYSRAIQDPVLLAYAEKKDMSMVLHDRLDMLTLALKSEYTKEKETGISAVHAYKATGGQDL